MIIPRVPPQHRAMLAQSRMSGPTPWVLALLMLLTLLSAAAGLSLARAANGIGGAIAGRVTVQVVTANPEQRSIEAGRIRRAAAAEPYVSAVRAVPRDEVIASMGRWLGSAGGESDPVIASLPLPELIDIDLVAGSGAAQQARLAALVARASPGARVTPHADWLGPVASTIRTLAWLAGALVVLMALASAAVVIMTARAALGSHFATIEMLHLIGATDPQICRLFQRRIAIDCAQGILLGALVAALLIGLFSWQFAGVSAGLGASAAIGAGGWIFLAMLPLLAIALAALTARVTLLRALTMML
ncbi:MAG: cell division protein [Sphingopyxis sp.]|nr:cell division protein [Sphingopyxis sp.]